MAFIVTEIVGSREVDLTAESANANLLFVGYGTTDDTDARSGFAAACPASFMGLSLKNVHIKHVGGLFWSMEARYESWVLTSNGQALGDTSGSPTPANPGDDPTAPLGPEYSVNISAVTEHITQSRRTVYRIKRFGGAGNNAPDNQGAIGVTMDGEIKGVDRFSPHMEISISALGGSASLNYYSTLYNMVGKVNDANFYGFEAGEVLFLGCDASSKDTTKVNFTWKFAMQPNQEDIVICDSLEVPEKLGWEYLWVAYEPVAVNGRMWMQPFAAYVEEIYELANFDVLQLGH